MRNAGVHVLHLSSRNLRQGASHATHHKPLNSELAITLFATPVRRNRTQTRCRWYSNHRSSIQPLWFVANHTTRSCSWEACLHSVPWWAAASAAWSSELSGYAKEKYQSPQAGHLHPPLCHALWNVSIDDPLGYWRKQRDNVQRRCCPRRLLSGSSQNFLAHLASAGPGLGEVVEKILRTTRKQCCYVIIKTGWFKHDHVLAYIRQDVQPSSFQPHEKLVNSSRIRWDSPVLLESTRWMQHEAVSFVKPYGGMAFNDP